MSVKDIQTEFERHWIVTFRAYEPLLRVKAPALVSLVSAIKGLAWNCYLQGRTDEMSREMTRERTRERRLVRTAISARLRQGQERQDASRD